MSITINELSTGIALLIDSDLFMVEEYHHVKPGKGAAFARVKLRSMKTDNVIERTFRTSEKLEEAVLEEKRMEYLYPTGDQYHFMDHSSYEEVVLTAEQVGSVRLFMLENLEVTGVFYNHQVLKVHLPTFITVQIASTEPGIRGDSSRSGTKPATIVTGAVVQVPLFVDTGEWVKIDTRSGTYVERVQK
jgi:elongation factor P